MPTVHTIHGTIRGAVRRTAHRLLPGAVHKARASMFGLAHYPDHYQDVAARIAAPLYRRVADDVTAAGLAPGSHILDLGTGPGLLPLRIVAACPSLRVDAVDIAPEMIERARVNGAAAPHADAVTFTVADVARLPFPDAEFDLVVSTLSQHHWNDPAAGLREVARVLRPGAQAWIYDVRWALLRAQSAAASIPPPVTAVRESPLAGTSWLNPLGRLVLQVPGAAS